MDVLYNRMAYYCLTLYPLHFGPFQFVEYMSSLL